MKTVKIRITATVETYVTIEDHEDITLRNADIYLHDEGEDGHLNKFDLGGDVKIEVINEHKVKE